MGCIIKHEQSCCKLLMKLSQHTLCIIYFVHTWTAIFLGHLANKSVMTSSSDQTEPLSSIFLVCLGLSCFSLQRFMFHTCTLPCQLDSLTLVHKQTISLCYLPYKWSHISTSHLCYYSFPSSYFFHFFHTYWAGRLAWSFLSGTIHANYYSP